MRHCLFAAFPFLFEEQHLFPHWIGSKQLSRAGAGGTRGVEEVVVIASLPMGSYLSKPMGRAVRGRWKV